MTTTEIEDAKDAKLMQWVDECDDIMKVAVANAIAENKRLGLYTSAEDEIRSPRVAEED